jgi:hypothetical protein
MAVSMVTEGFVLRTSGRDGRVSVSIGEDGEGSGVDGLRVCLVDMVVIDVITNLRR